MSSLARPQTCPQCDDPLAFTFEEASGLGAWKLGDGFNTVPDTAHYVCFPCAKAWKQRLTGPLTPDVVGDLAFFTCGQPDCGSALSVTTESPVATEVRLSCGRGHQYAVEPGHAGGLVLSPAL